MALSEADVKDMFAALCPENVFNENVKITQDIDFHGFNRTALMTSAWNKAGGKKDVLLSDATKFAIIGNRRGFKNSKIFRGMTITGDKFTRTLFDKYEMSTADKEASSLKDGELTVARWAALFPVIYLQVSAKYGKYIGLTPQNEWGIPTCYCTSMGGILIAKEYYEVWLRWAKEYTWIINKGRNFEEKWEKTFQILMVQRETRKDIGEIVLGQINVMFSSNMPESTVLGYTGSRKASEVVNTPNLENAMKKK